MVTGIELVGVDGGGGVRVAGGVGEGGLGVEERRAHEHRKSMRKLLGVALVHGLPLGWPVRGEHELAGGGAEGERRRGCVWAPFRTRGA